MYIAKNSIRIEATNVSAFKKLIEKAENEARQLNETIHQLSCFELDIQFSFGEDPEGDMEAASSTIKSMQTK